MNQWIVRKVNQSLKVEEDSISYIKISYFLESVLSEMEKTVMIVFLFFMIGYGVDGLLVLAVLAVLRPYLGGTHFQSFWLCFFVTFVFCILPIMLQTYTMPIGIYILICIVAVVLLICYAPVRSEFRIEYHGTMLMKIRTKGLFALAIVNVVYLIVDIQWRNMIAYAVLILVVDCIFAGHRKGFSKLH